MEKKKKIFNMGDRVIHKFRGLGTFECYAPIADAYTAAARELHGEFARIA